MNPTTQPTFLTPNPSNVITEFHASPNTSQSPNQARAWQLVNLNPRIATRPDASITLKIRGEEAENFVPEKLYSSHKYFVTHMVRNINQYTDQLTARIIVEDPMTNQEVLSKEGKIIVKHVNSTLEPQLAFSEQENALVGEMRMQFTSSSYKFGKGYFRMRFSYFNAAGEQMFALQSPPFRVYARKTSTDTQTLAPGKKKVTGKRKRKEKPAKEDDASPKSKKVKSEPQTDEQYDASPPPPMHPLTKQEPLPTPHHEQINWLAQHQQQMQQQQLLSQHNHHLPPHHQSAHDVALQGPDVISQPNSILTTDATSSQTHLFSQFQEKLQHLMAIHQHIKKPDVADRARVESLGKLYSLSPQAVENALTTSSMPLEHSSNSNGSSTSGNSMPPRMQIPSNLPSQYPTSFQTPHFQQMMAAQQGPPQQQQQSHYNFITQQQQQQQYQPQYSFAAQAQQQQFVQQPQLSSSTSQQMALSQQTTLPPALSTSAETHTHSFQLPPMQSTSQREKDLVLANPRPFFLAEAHKSGSFKSLSPLISTPKLLDDNLKLKTPTDELLRSVKSPDKFEGFDTSTVITPSIVSTPSEFFVKDFGASPSVFSDSGKFDK